MQLDFHEYNIYPLAGIYNINNADPKSLGL